MPLIRAWNGRSLFPLLLLNGLAMAGNLFTLPLLPGVDFLFGSIAVMLTLRLFGLWWGILAALLASSVTVFHVHHPYGIPIFVSEAALVGLVLRRHENLPIVDALYWLVFGMPLVGILYYWVLRIDPGLVSLIALKDAVNGIFNALLASILLNTGPLRRWIADREQRVAIDQILFNVMAISVFFPALLLIVLNGRTSLSQIELESINNLRDAGDEIGTRLLIWRDNHLEALQELGLIALKNGLRPSQTLQESTQLLHRAFPDLNLVYVADARARSIAFSPLRDEQGRSTLGRVYADRAYFKTMRTTHAPVLSDVYVGRVAAMPVVSLSVPILKRDRFAGYTYASMNLSALRDQLHSSVNKGRLIATLLDSRGKVISSTDPSLAPFQAFRFGQGTFRHIADDVLQFIPGGKHSSTLERLKHSYYVKRKVLGMGIPWTLLIEIPVSAQILSLQFLYIQDLFVLLVLTLLIFIISWVLSRRLSSPLGSLAEATGVLPDEATGSGFFVWPQSGVREVNELIQNFRRMAETLSQKFRDLGESQRQLQEKTDRLEGLNQALETEIQERRSTEERLYHLAHHDPLTSLPNRFLFIDRLDQAMRFARRHQYLLAVMFLDLDRFKIVNDSLGHINGDLLLQQVALRISGCLRSEDTVARLGGDEFLLILSEIRHPADAEASARKILTTFREPFLAQGREIHLSASIGITFFPDDSENIDDLIKNADIAMYRAKESGRNTCRCYRREMSSGADQRLELEGMLRRALDRNELLLYYQPQICLHSRRTIGVEALLRWQHPTQGFISPADFIPLAEETGLIVPIGEWVIRNAVREARAWEDSGFGRICMNVNLSGRQLLEAGFDRCVQAALAESGFQPENLELELTESVLMRNTDMVIDIMRALCEMGIRFAIDDFGTGYSSLSYLKLFPISKLKIDQGFVRDVTTDPNDAAIAQTIIAMAHTLNMRVTAEGVETEAQLDFLRTHGCDEVQGFFLSRPLPAEKMREFLRDGVAVPV